jgi:hypothetical protein
MIRLLYFGYYLKKLNYKLLVKFQRNLKETKGLLIIYQWFLILYNSLKYNISILEYYQFRFYGKSREERKKWAGTGHMFEYQKLMNPIKHREILDDKRLFYEKYNQFFKHSIFRIENIEKDKKIAEILCKEKILVFKVSDGKCGVSVNIKTTENLNESNLLQFMNENGYDMVETFLVQHKDLQRLSPSGVNTVRIFTQLNTKNEVEILGCRQRISVDSKIDNLAAGNIAAPINEITGVIDGPAVYSDITKEPEIFHPITKMKIVDFQVPFWKECIDLAKQAALLHPQNRSIGWDIVITDSGPGLIEGNHDWCKLLWQLPVNTGLKHLLKIS